MADAQSLGYWVAALLPIGARRAGIEICRAAFSNLQDRLINVPAVIDTTTRRGAADDRRGRHATAPQGLNVVCVSLCSAWQTGARNGLTPAIRFDMVRLPAGLVPGTDLLECAWSSAIARGTGKTCPPPTSRSHWRIRVKPNHRGRNWALAGVGTHWWRSLKTSYNFAIYVTAETGSLDLGFSSDRPDVTAPRCGACTRPGFNARELAEIIEPLSRIASATRHELRRRFAWGRDAHLGPCRA